jgi:hypothetical protein
MPIINGITVTELRSGFEEGMNSQGPHARKSFLVEEWSDRYAVANGLLGFVQSVPGAVGGSFAIARPAVYPDSPNLYCREVTIQGIGKFSDGAMQSQFEKAVVSAHYGVPTFAATRQADPAAMHGFSPAQPILYATQELDFSVEYIKLPGASLQLSDGTPVYDDFPFRVPIAHLNLTLHQVPYLDMATIYSKMGLVNNATFLGGATGKVMFMGGRNRMGAYTDGSYTQELLLSFNYRQFIRWDQVVKPGTSTFLQLQFSGGSAVIASTDLTTLIPTWYNG